MRGVMSGEAFVEASDSSPPEARGVSKPRTMLAAGAAGAMPFFFLRRLFFIMSLLRMADRGSPFAPFRGFVKVRVGDVGTAMSAGVLLSKSMAGILVQSKNTESRYLDKSLGVMGEKQDVAHR